MRLLDNFAPVSVTICGVNHLTGNSAALNPIIPSAQVYQLTSKRPIPPPLSSQRVCWDTRVFCIFDDITVNSTKVEVGIGILGNRDLIETMIETASLKYCFVLL